MDPKTINALAALRGAVVSLGDATIPAAGSTSPFSGIGPSSSFGHVTEVPAIQPETRDRIVAKIDEATTSSDLATANGILETVGGLLTAATGIFGL